MKAISAVRAFLEKDSVRGKIPAGEMMEFWKVCTPEEKQSFATQAAKELGETLEA